MVTTLTFPLIQRQICSLGAWLKVIEKTVFTKFFSINTINNNATDFKTFQRLSVTNGTYPSALKALIKPIVFQKLKNIIGPLITLVLMLIIPQIGNSHTSTY